MKIAIVANSTWNIFNFRQSLIKLLNENSYEILVIAPQDKYANSLDTQFFSKLIKLKQLNAQSRNLWQEFKLLKELYGIYKKEKPDLILHYTIKPNIYGSIAAKILNIPCIATLTGLGSSFLNKSHFNPIIEKLYKFALSNIIKTVFHNQDDLELFVSKGLVERKDSMIIPGSGVNTKHFQPEIGSQRKKLVFLFMGRLIRDKGIYEFIEAALDLIGSNLKVEFHVAGNYDKQNPYSISPNELSEWIKFDGIYYLGEVKDVRELLHSSDVLVLPSYREGLPRAILEAMSMAKPIITTDVPGCRATVEEGKNGFLVPARNSKALSESMRKMYEISADARKNMGDYSRLKVTKEFDEEIINEAYLNLINPILSSV